MIKLLKWLLGILDEPYSIEEMMIYDFFDEE